MNYYISEEKLIVYIDAFFKEKEKQPFETFNKTLLLRCVLENESTDDLIKNNLFLKNLVIEFKNWLRPRIRIHKMKNLDD
ncbi:hypothetical protein [Cesiribacter sp. SM1]|uniref:hypothetical protein n=1 Tax=Cesiribacter sp. SM1 TaxID=2861196 RepID=UPI001CD2EC02|nr:hypothetical protein [Cesiribacter sp. SM1]